MYILCTANKKVPGKTGLKFHSGTSGCAKRPLLDDATCRLSKHPVFTIPGVSRHNVCQDALHILWCKGICNHAIGSALHQMIYPGKHKVGPEKAKERLGRVVVYSR